MRFALFLLLASLLGQDGKAELRYAFEKGEKVALRFNQRIRVTITEIPEEFQELFADDAVDVKLKGEALLQVSDVKDGTAVLEGKFQILTASGTFLLTEIDFDYDRSRDGDKPKEADSDDGPGIMGVNPGQSLRGMAIDPIKIEIDALGTSRIFSKGAAKGFSDRVLQLAGVMGPVSKEKVGAGDKWKGTAAMAIPNLPFRLKIDSDTAFEKKGESSGAACAILKSSLKITSEEEKPVDGEEPTVKVGGKVEGTGEQTTHFALERGRPLKIEAKLKLTADLKMTNPAGGDDIVIKAKIEMTQGADLKKP